MRFRGDSLPQRRPQNVIGVNEKLELSFHLSSLSQKVEPDINFMVTPDGHSESWLLHEMINLDKLLGNGVCVARM